MENAQSNVVNLAQFDKGKKALNPADALALLNQCRDRFILAIEHVWNEQRDAIEMNLVAAGDNSPILENRNWYFQAQNLLRHRNESLVTGFRKQITSKLEKLAQVRAQHSANNESIIDDLSLVDEEMFETTLAIRKVASRLQMDAVESLAALDRRVAMLLQNVNGRSGDNPFAPTDLCEAFLAACSALDADTRIKLILLQQFDASVVPVMPNIYQELNQFLIGKEILPDLKIGSDRAHGRSSAQRTNVATGLPGMQHAGNNDDNSDAGGMGGASGTGVDLFALLQQLLARSQLAQGKSWTEPSGFAGEGGGQMAGDPILTLTQLQRGQYRPSVPVNFDLSRLQTGGGNYLRDLREAGLVRAENRTDDFVIDIVSMMFDHIFDDDDIPAALKALIGRLQIPMLKVAMLDRQFFSRKNHPARHLLDEIASASMGWVDEGEDNKALYTKISAIIQSVLNDFNDDISIFDTLSADLQAFMAEHEAKTQIKVTQTANAMESAERVHLAEVLVNQTIEKIRQEVLGDSSETIPELIDEFIKISWHRVLLERYTKGGDTDPAWQTGMKTTRNLFWSVLPKLNTEDRLKLVSMLPELLQQLREGMEQIGVAGNQRDILFSALIAAHSAAVKAGVQPTTKAPIDTEAYRTVLSEVAAKPVAALEEITDVPIEHFDFSPDPVETLHDDEFTEQARTLKKGMWLEFTNPDGSQRTARLSWVSSLRGVYLFTDNQGLNAITITLPRLAARFRNSTARPMKSGSLTERAVDRLIHRLQGKK